MAKKVLRLAVVLVVLVCICFSGSVFAENNDLTLPAGPAIPSSEEAAPSAAAGPDQSTRSTGNLDLNVDDASNHERVPSIITYGKEFFPDLVRGTDKLFSDENLEFAVIGGGLAIASVAFDHRVKQYFQTRRPLDGLSHYGDTIGQGYYHIGIGMALLGAGELGSSRQLADTGIVVLESFAVNGILTTALKYSTDRLRPNGSNHMSFPSGHSSSTAAVAASISAMYDWDPKIAVPLYGTAVFVGLSRIQDNMHYLSDVVAGLTLGTLVGTTFARDRKEKNLEEKNRHTLSFSPLFDGDMKGGMLTLKW